MANQMRTTTARGTLFLEYNLGSTAALNLPHRGRLNAISDVRRVSTVIAGPLGHFRISLPAGRYRFRLVTPARHSCTTDPATFTVRIGKPNDVQVFCLVNGAGERSSKQRGRRRVKVQLRPLLHVNLLPPFGKNFTAGTFRSASGEGQLRRRQRPLRNVASAGCPGVVWFLPGADDQAVRTPSRATGLIVCGGQPGTPGSCGTGRRPLGRRGGGRTLR